MRVLLTITGGIAAYKCLELIRRGQEFNIDFTCVLTNAASHFVTPLALGSISQNKVYQELLSLTDEHEMGHIRLARQAELVLVAPATADFIAKMAHGIADDLASTLMLAADCPIWVAPSMNPYMWEKPSTRRNIAQLKADGVKVIEPEKGDTACGEHGQGRMAEPMDILRQITRDGDLKSGSLAKKHFIVTSGPTREAIDPVRYISNHSSGKQGHVIAEELAKRGARVTLVHGPVSIDDPLGVDLRAVVSANDMFEAVKQALPADCAICVAAVSDWRPATTSGQKIKKSAGSIPVINLTENQDILAYLGHSEINRPPLVIGFAAESEYLAEYAGKKLANKGCDWVLANLIGEQGSVFGSDRNNILFIERGAPSLSDSWGDMTKREVAEKLCDKIERFFNAG